MRHLRDDTVLILDGEVRVYRRERSRRWQAAFSIDGKAIRISTGKKDLNEAKEIARDTYLEYKFRHKNDLPVITKKFADVARLAIADMRKQLDAGLGKKVYADYIVCIERYLIRLCQNKPPCPTASWKLTSVTCPILYLSAISKPVQRSSNLR